MLFHEHLSIEVFYASLENPATTPSVTWSTLLPFNVGDFELHTEGMWLAGETRVFKNARPRRKLILCVRLRIMLLEEGQTQKKGIELGGDLGSSSRPALT